MKIWYVAAYDQPMGQSSRTWDFSVELAARGHSVSMFTNSFCHFTRTERIDHTGKWRVEFRDRVKIVWIKTRPYLDNGLQRGLNMLDNFFGTLRAAAAMNERPDVLIGPSVPLMTGYVAWRLAGLHKCPFIFEVRDVWPDALVDIGGLSRTSPVYWAFRYIEKTLYDKAARISSTLPYIGEHVAKSGGDPRKIVFIPNGIDTSHYDLIPARKRLREAKLIVMYVGGFGLDHDVRTIICAAKLLQDENDTRFSFVFFGSGVGKEGIVRLAANFGLKNVDFRPPIPKAQVPFAQSEADILIASITDSPSYRFGLNLNKLCSYFASGKPVLFSGNPPNNPVIESGGGVSVRAEDPKELATALKTLAELPIEARAKMGELGRRYVKEKLNLKTLGDELEAMLVQAVDVNAGKTSC